MKDCGSLQRAQKGRETCPFRALDGFNEIRLTLLKRMAGTTRLELATSAVAGARSYQMNYVPPEGNTQLTRKPRMRASPCFSFGPRQNSLAASFTRTPC